VIYSEHTTGCVINAEHYLTLEEFMVMVIGLAYMNGFDVDIDTLAQKIDILAEEYDDESAGELDDLFNAAIWFLEEDAPEGFEWKLEGKALYLNQIG
jgi:hypothetical protein